MNAQAHISFTMSIIMPPHRRKNGLVLNKRCPPFGGHLLLLLLIFYLLCGTVTVAVAMTVLTAGVDGLIRDGVNTSVASARAFCAQVEGVVIHDHNVVGFVAIALSVIRLVRCD